MGSAIYHAKGKGSYLLFAPEAFSVDNVKALNPTTEHVKAAAVKNVVAGFIADFQLEHIQKFKDTS